VVLLSLLLLVELLLWQLCCLSVLVMLRFLFTVHEP